MSRMQQQPGTWPSHAIAVALLLGYALAAIGFWLGLWGQHWALPGNPAWLDPSLEHWLGTNRLGQDLFARSLRATATAFEIGLPVALMAVAAGAGLGATAGLRAGNWLDDLILWLASTLDAIPFYLFVAALAFALQGHAWGMQLAMVLTFWTATARIIRSETRRVMTLPFIEAARVAGQPGWRIVLNHILPNLRHLLVIQFALIFVAAIKAEVILSFLGIGGLDRVSWGIMLAEAAEDILNGHYMNLVAATLSLFGLVLAINLLADRHAQPVGTGSRHA